LTLTPTLSRIGRSYERPSLDGLPGRGGALRRLGQMALGLFDDRGEGRGLGDCELGQHLAVDLDPGRREAGNEPAVGQPVLARRRVDPLDPQGAELAFAVLAVAVGVLHRPVDRGLGGADRVLAAAGIAFGGLENLLVLGVGGYAPLDA